MELKRLSFCDTLSTEEESFPKTAVTELESAPDITKERESFSISGFYRLSFIFAYLLAVALVRPNTLEDLLVALLWAAPASVLLFAPVLVPAGALLALMLLGFLRSAKPFIKFVKLKLE